MHCVINFPAMWIDTSRFEVALRNSCGQGATVKFGTVIDGTIVICHAHGDTLEDLEQRGLPADSEQIVEAFHRHEDLLRRLALEKVRWDLVETDGTIFLAPKDLTLLPVWGPRAHDNY